MLRSEAHVYDISQFFFRNKESMLKVGKAVISAISKLHFKARLNGFAQLQYSTCKGRTDRVLAV
jgi:hypothetical protein